MTTLDAKGVVLEIWANPWANSVVRLLFEYQDVIKPKERRDIVRLSGCGRLKLIELLGTFSVYYGHMVQLLYTCEIPFGLSIPSNH